MKDFSQKIQEESRSNKFLSVKGKLDMSLTGTPRIIIYWVLQDLGLNNKIKPQNTRKKKRKLLPNQTLQGFHATLMLIQMFAPTSSVT